MRGLGAPSTLERRQNPITLSDQIPIIVGYRILARTPDAFDQVGYRKRNLRHIFQIPISLGQCRGHPGFQHQPLRAWLGFVNGAKCISAQASHLSRPQSCSQPLICRFATPFQAGTSEATDHCCHERYEDQRGFVHDATLRAGLHRPVRTGRQATSTLLRLRRARSNTRGLQIDIRRLLGLPILHDDAPPLRIRLPSEPINDGVVAV